MSNSSDSVRHPCCDLAGSRTGEDFKEGPSSNPGNSSARRRACGIRHCTARNCHDENKGRIKLNASLEAFLAEIEARFIVLPITGRICVSALALPAAYPRDPADRVIGATALV